MVRGAFFLFDLYGLLGKLQGLCIGKNHGF